MNLIRKNKRYLILISTALITTLAYFAPFLISALRGFKPELRFLGDLQLAGFPAFIQTGKYFRDFTFQGIDFFTANGSSSLFMRPNFSSYYLPQVLLQNLFRVSDNTNAAKLFTVQLWLNGLMAMLFTTAWLNRIMRINIYPALLGGALFFSIVGYIYSQVSFLNVACVFPALMYCLCVTVATKTTLPHKILLSLPLVMILTAGYLPIAVMGICVAVAATLAVAGHISDSKPRYKDMFIVLGIGAVVISGYMVTIINAFRIVPAIPKIPLIESIFFADLALTYKGVLALALASVPNDSGEAAHFRLGLPVLLLAYISYSHLKAAGNTWKKNAFLISMLFFLLSILLGLGRISGFADVFFYSVPGLGGMHIYARYMLISVFFLVFGIALGLSNAYLSDDRSHLKIPAIGIALGFISVLLFPDAFTKNQISLPLLFVELLISAAMLMVLGLKGDRRLILLMIPLVVFHQGSFVYMTTNWISLSNTGSTAKDIVNSEVRTKALLAYFYGNSDKLLIKYIDLTPEIEKHGGVPHNFPWFVRYAKGDQRRISSYMGYDQGLAQQLEYAQRFSYFGQFDKNYLIDSGVDYILYDRKTRIKEDQWINAIVDRSVQEHDIGNGFFAAKVLPKKELNRASLFDNGVISVEGDSLDFKSDFFATNWSSNIDFSFHSSKAGVLNFRLFPHRFWKYQLNGSDISPGMTSSGLAFFTFPPGENRFTVRYSNIPNKFFLWTYCFYLILIFLITLRPLAHYLRHRTRRVPPSGHPAMSSSHLTPGTSKL